LPVLIKFLMVPHFEEGEKTYRLVVPDVALLSNPPGAMTIQDTIVASLFSGVDFEKLGKPILRASTLADVLRFCKKNTPTFLHLGRSVYLRRSIFYSLLRQTVGLTPYDVTIRVLDPLEATIFFGNSVLSVGDDTFLVRFRSRRLQGFTVLEFAPLTVSTSPMMIVPHTVWYQHPHLSMDLSYVNRKVREVRWSLGDDDGRDGPSR